MLGSDLNGGGFDTNVAGFPTDGTTDANTGNTSAPVFSSASYNFVAGDVGAWIYIKSGTSSIPGWYKIASVASNKATLNAAIGAAVLAAGIPSTAVGIATVGTPTTLTWGIDYSQSTTAKIAFTDMVIGGTTTQFTSIANPVGKNFVGNIINVTSGTGFTVQRVAVVSTSGTTATCDKSLGTGASTGGVGNLGGAVLSPSIPCSLTVNGSGTSQNVVWIKTGAYTVTSASTGVAGGCINLVGTNGRVEGYGTVRGDIGTPPTLTASGISSFAMVTTPNNSLDRVVNITCDCASLTSGRAFILGSTLGYKLTAKNATNNGFITNTGVAVLVQCVATGCSTQAAFNNGTCFGCVAYSNTITGFTSGSTNFCISYNNSGASSDGFSLTAGSITANCVAYNNGRHGFGVSTINYLINCIAESNTGTGFNCTTTANILINCAAFSNGTNLSKTGIGEQDYGFITYTASAFVAASSGNFALNANAGGGALLRAAGIPGITPDGFSTGYLDVGALESRALMYLGLEMQGGMVN